MGVPERRLPQIPFWIWVSMLPLGVGAWAPLVPANRCKKRSWALWGVLWSVITVLGWVVAAASQDEDRGDAGLLIILSSPAE